MRQERLAEAIEVLRLLWKGGNRSHHGTHYTVENSRLYTLPPRPPDVYVAVGGAKSAALAVRLGDGMLGTSADDVKAHDRAGGGTDTPRYGELTVC